MYVYIVAIDDSDVSCARALREEEGEPLLKRRRRVDAAGAERPQRGVRVAEAEAQVDPRRRPPRLHAPRAPAGVGIGGPHFPLFEVEGSEEGAASSAAVTLSKRWECQPAIGCWVRMVNASLDTLQTKRRVWAGAINLASSWIELD